MKLSLQSCSALGSIKICIFLLILFSAPYSVYCQICATPGKDGVLAGNVSVVNTFYPGTSSVSAGTNKSLSVGTPTGNATPIIAGDLVLIIQM